MREAPGAEEDLARGNRRSRHCGRADGSDRRRLTDTADPASADNPTWSPDGRLVVFISNRARSDQPRLGSPDVNAWVIPAGGGEPRLLVEGATYCAWAPLSPPGRQS